MSRYYIRKVFKHISDNDDESQIIFNVILYKNNINDAIYTKEFKISFDINKKIIVTPDLEIAADSNDAAILLVELMDGGELVYGKR